MVSAEGVGLLRLKKLFVGAGVSFNLGEKRPPLGAFGCECEKEKAVLG